MAHRLCHRKAHSPPIEVDVAGKEEGQIGALRLGNAAVHHLIAPKSRDKVEGDILFTVASHKLFRLVLGGRIDDDQLEIGIVLLQQAIDSRRQVRRRLEGGDDDRDLRIVPLLISF